MSLLGVHMALSAGPTVPLPVPPDVAQRVKSVQVTESDSRPTVFSIVLDAGRSGPTAALDSPVLTTSPLRANARVVVELTMGVLPKVLVDGIVTEATLVPGGEQHRAELTLTGRDLSVLLDRMEVSDEHVALEDSLQVLAIAAQYAQHGILPTVIPPPTMDPPLPMERTPTQQATDWRHISDLAQWHGFVCCMIPGPVRGMSSLYWGPTVRAGLPQPAISVDLGPATNVQGQVSFTTDVLRPENVEGQVQDVRSGQTLPVRTVAPTRPPLSALPVWVEHQASLRSRQFRGTGVSAAAAFARAQGVLDASVDAMTASGTLDGGAYGSVLRPRMLVGMRGAGWSADGIWYVQQVVHHVTRGAYTASFTLQREGSGALTPVVMV